MERNHQLLSPKVHFHQKMKIYWASDSESSLLAENIAEDNYDENVKKKTSQKLLLKKEVMTNDRLCLGKKSE